ncbi:transglycosylase domain-containing protein [Roseibium suaedae]|uniref:Penicillin-binding protein 1A n=1 Tax=Roseibium suaedae TaxID=735517 RepID=A0A1M7MCR5_9HYPH|nr:transglycosylase domain-containing protein [Roseibium suaedae]SHM88660.1 penicillin-binding protein 1A [Roseibium suaedae]
MANGTAQRKRIEPKFEADGQSALDLRPSERDRVAQPARKKPAQKRTGNTSGQTRRRASSGKGGGGGKGGSGGRRKSRRSRRNGSLIGFVLKKAIYWSFVLGIWAGVLGIGVLGYYAAFLPPTSEWKVPQRPPNVKIVSANGELLANRGDTGGEAVRLEQLPPYLPNAVIAIEDRRFRSHFGLDPLGLARAVVVNLTSGNLVQGGSTLTQQLAKNLFLEQDRTLKRKMQELVLSIWLEAKFSKDEILEMYLNRVYLGSGAYGVDAAARRYFGKSARLVTVAEAATLAGLLKAPTRYSPARNPDLAEARAQLVLAAMREEGYITDKEAKSALAEPAKAINHHTRASTNYVADWVMDLLPHYVGSVDTDIIVDTTIDPKIQKGAEEALRKALAEDANKHKVSQGAIVVLDTAGSVRAMVGGRDYSESQFNRAAYAKRQPGSAFKPFVYLAALERGLTPDTIREDKPVSFKGWAPQNYSKQYFGPVTLTRALSLSLNTVAAQLAYEVGPKAVISTAKQMGITSEMKPNLSISLGTSEVTPVEIAGAYVPFSNGGYGVLPNVVRQIRTTSGKILYSRQGDGPGRVIDRALVGQMNRMMAETLETGTGKKAQLSGGRPAGGKTGTSQDFRDAWFIGYTGNYTTAVWLGNDDNSPTNKASGGSLPAVIWKDTMEAAHEGLPVSDLPGAPGMLAGEASASSDAPVRNITPPANVGSGGDVIRPPAGNSNGGPLKLLKSIFGG